MDRQYQNFQSRVSRISRDRTARSHDSFQIKPDGLVVPRRRARWRPRVPVRTLVLVVICLMALRGFFVWHMGAEDHDARIAELARGAMLEAPAVWLASSGPVTLWVAAQYDLMSEMLRSR